MWLQVLFYSEIWLHFWSAYCGAIEENIVKIVWPWLGTNKRDHHITVDTGLFEHSNVKAKDTYALYSDMFSMQLYM